MFIIINNNETYGYDGTELTRTQTKNHKVTGTENKY